MRIAVCADRGATHRSGWSGTPWNIYTGLEDAGAEVVSIEVLPPAIIRKPVTFIIALTQTRRQSQTRYRERLRASREHAHQHPLFLTLCSLVANIRLKRVGHVDAVVQMGTHYNISHKVVCSYEDMTVRQALTLPQSHLRFLSPQQQRSRIQRQEKAYRRNTLALFSTQWPALSALTEYGIPAEKVHVVGIGRNYSPQPVSRNWDIPRVLFIGKNFALKGGSAAISAFARVRERYPQAELHVVGHHPPLNDPGVFGYGPLSLDNERDALELEGLWNKATCLVVPAQYEAAGIVFAEAASAGIPSIGSSIGGAQYVIGAGGYTVSPDKPDDLVNTMLQLCDPSHARELGARAHAQSASFEWEHINNHILQLLNDAV